MGNRSFVYGLMVCDCLRVGVCWPDVYVCEREKERERKRVHYLQGFGNYPPKLEVKEEREGKCFFLFSPLIRIHSLPGVVSLPSSVLPLLSSPLLQIIESFPL